MTTEPLVKELVQPVLARGLSYEKFLEWPGENQHVEWVAGDVVAMSPITEKHQEISQFLLVVVGQYVRSREVGRVLFDPFQMRLANVGRAPDLIFVSNANLARLHKTHLDGPADLAVEIINPGSRKTDTQKKFAEYQAGGVAEYWLIDPKNEKAHWYQLGNGRYREAELTDGVYRSRAIEGLWLREEWLWQVPTPNALDVLREWKLI